MADKSVRERILEIRLKHKFQVILETDRRIKAGKFDEDKHPRDHGKFSSKPGADGEGDKDKPSARDAEPDEVGPTSEYDVDELRERQPTVSEDVEEPEAPQEEESVEPAERSGKEVKIRDGFHGIQLANPEVENINERYYTHADGETVSGDLAARLKALKLPPKWTNVQVSASPDTPLQATGIDDKGREQRVYSAAHSEQAAAAKFLRVKALVEKLPALDARLQEDLHGEDHVSREAAAVLLLMRKTEHEALGASTLTGDNVQIDGDRVRFEFIGKKGVKIEQELEDAALAEMLGPRIRSGEKLFDTNDSKVRDYMHRVAGAFKPKDLRTVVAAETALATIAAMKEPQSDKEFKKARTAVGKIISTKLGNTPAVALSSYIPPEVFFRWEDNVKKARAETETKSVKPEERRPPVDEATLLQDFVQSVHYAAPEWSGLNAIPDQEDGHAGWDTPETAADNDD